MQIHKYASYVEEAKLLHVCKLISYFVTVYMAIIIDK